jgi:hypothetical protein
MVLTQKILDKIVALLKELGEVHLPSTCPQEHKLILNQVLKVTPNSLQPLHVRTDTQGRLLLRSNRKQSQLDTANTVQNIMAMNYSQSVTDHMGF